MCTCTNLFSNAHLSLWGVGRVWLYIDDLADQTHSFSLPIHHIAARPPSQPCADVFKPRGVAPYIRLLALGLLGTAIAYAGVKCDDTLQAREL